MTAELVAAADDVALGFASSSLEDDLARNAKERAREASGAIPPATPKAIVPFRRRLERLGAAVVRTCGAGGGGHVLVWAPRERQSVYPRRAPPITMFASRASLPEARSSRPEKPARNGQLFGYRPRAISTR